MCESRYFVDIENGRLRFLQTGNGGRTSPQTLKNLAVYRTRTDFPTFCPPFAFCAKHKSRGILEKVWKKMRVCRGGRKGPFLKRFFLPLCRKISHLSAQSQKLKDFPVSRKRRASSSLKPHSKGLIRSGFKSKKAVAVSH